METEPRSAFLTRPGSSAAEHRIAAWLLVRSLAAIHLIAFASLWVQVDGLAGDDGILPVRELLRWASRLGPRRFWLLPTLAWAAPGEAALHACCALGVGVAAVLLVFGLLPNASLLALWALYLSLCVAGQDFLSFQWDVLLLEATFLAAFLPRLAWRHRLTDAPDPAFLWLSRWLLFRLLFASGAVKLTSGDPTWRALTALTFHYETQPLPTALGWWAHQLPPLVQKASCAVMFGIELLVPLLIFCGRRARRAAFFPLVLLQVLIAATGNYAFFNLLTLALCLPLLTDDVFPAFLTSRLERGEDVPRGGSRLRLVLAGLLLVASVPPFLGAFGLRPRGGPLARLDDVLGPFRTVNGYGLFAVMTTERPEIVLEGSRDGEAWREYALPFKPGDVARVPRRVAPYQPRLDWQLWFAALSSAEATPWFSRLLERLLTGSPEVLALLSENPFPGAPPRFVRAVLYRYRFTTISERRRTGAVWSRERLGLYCPPVSLRGWEDGILATP